MKNSNLRINVQFTQKNILDSDESVCDVNIGHF